MIQQTHFWAYTRKYVINSKTNMYLNTNNSTTYSKIAKTWNSSAHQIITYTHTHTHTHTYTHTFLNQSSVYIRITCVCVYIYTMEYSSVIKENKILPFVATRMDLENIGPRPREYS